MVDENADFTPRLLGALIILLVGWWIAKFIRNLIQKLLDRPAVTKVIDRSGVGPALRNAGYTGASILANIIYAILLLAVFLLAAQALQVPELVSLLSGLIAYLPLVVVAIVILVIAPRLGTSWVIWCSPGLPAVMPRGWRWSPATP